MVQIAPADPFLRKMILPSIIRISDARTKRNLSYPATGSRKLHFSKTTHHFQLKLEL